MNAVRADEHVGAHCLAAQSGLCVGEMRDHSALVLHEALQPEPRAHRAGTEFGDHFVVDRLLQEHSGATMGELADRTSVDRTTLTRTLGLMESAGLLARREQKSDRRSLAISLTADGRRMFARILPLTLAETDRALTGFSPDEIEVLRAQLQRMADNLKAT